MNAVDAIPEKFKRKPGRPKGSGKLTMNKLANNPSIVLPKTEVQQVRELKELLIQSAGKNVVHKAIQIAMDDEHPSQAAMLKLCMDRMLPVSLFEKEGKQRNAVTINITGIGGVEIDPVVIDTQDVQDVEDKNG
jgi:hypothetical protein